MKIKILTLIVMSALALTSLKADCKYQLFNVTADDNVKIGDILRHVSNECGYTVIIRDNFAQDVMQKPLFLLNLRDATVDEVLDVTLTENDLNYTIDGSILRVSYLFTETFNVDYIGSDRKGSSSTNVNLNSNTGDDDNGDGSQSRTEIISGDEFIFWSKLQREVETILNRPEDSYSSTRSSNLQDLDSGEELSSDIFVNKEAGLVTVTGTKRQIQRVRQYIDQLHDRLKRQVLIDVHILNVELDNSRSTGIDWSQLYSLQNFDAETFASVSTEGGDRAGISLAGNAEIGEVIKFLKGQGDVTAVSNPKVLTLNNQPALISVGNEFFYKTRSTNITSGDGATTTTEDEEINSIFSGVLLDVTPEISDDGMITMKISPSLSDELNPRANVDGATRTMPPDMTRRQMSSVVTIKDGEKAVLGGLITSRDGLQTSQVPLLGNLPLLGYAFKRETEIETRNELVIIVQPKIISGRDPMNLKELGYDRLEW